MAERKIESGQVRPLVLLQQLVNHVVDRHDVIGINCVPQPEYVGE
jgi:hypothetical protein